MYITRTRTALIAAAAALTIAGCSDEPTTGTEQTNGPASTASTTEAARSDFNAADVTFLQMMYPHHAQAVEMAELAPQRTQNQELLGLADAINQAQGPEMQQMTTLLQGFGKPAPTEGEHDSGHGQPSNQEGHGGHNDHGKQDHGEHGHEGHSSGMPGMMSPESMQALTEANGEAFDRMWLEMMIEHHQGAIDMAHTEIAEGSNTEAKTMAETIIGTQHTEIEQMNTMLGR